MCFFQIFHLFKKCCVECSYRSTLYIYWQFFWVISQKFISKDMSCLRLWIQIIKLPSKRLYQFLFLVMGRGGGRGRGGWTKERDWSDNHLLEKFWKSFLNFHDGCYNAKALNIISQNIKQLKIWWISLFEFISVCSGNILRNIELQSHYFPFVGP